MDRSDEETALLDDHWESGSNLTDAKQKLVDIKNSLSKYLIEYDVVSLCRFETDDSDEKKSHSEIIASMKGLKKWMMDMDNVFVQAVIDNQRALEYIQLSLNELKILEERLKFDVERKGESFGGEMEPLNNLQRVQLKSKLQSLYDTVTSLIDSKLLLFRLTNEVVSEYQRCIISIALIKRVVMPTERVKTFLAPHFTKWNSHSVFDTTEEKKIIESISLSWSGLDLEGIQNPKNYLANYHLAKESFSKNFQSWDRWLYAKIGCVFILLLWSLSECLTNESMGRDIWDDPTFAIFIWFGDFILMLLLWACCIYVWKSCGIDFVGILGLSSTELKSMKYAELNLLSTGSDLSLILLVVFICFNKAVRIASIERGSLSIAHALPLSLVLLFIYKVVNPFQKRKIWLQMLWRVLAAPFYEVHFRDGYIGDLLTSLVRVAIPLFYSFVYLILSLVAWIISNDMKFTNSTSDSWWKNSTFFGYFVLPFLTLYPLWLRLVQCLRRTVETEQRWPHLFNAFKYTSAIIVISYGTFRPDDRSHFIWILAFTFATLYQYVWDIFQDWGFVELKFLNDHYRSQSVFDRFYHQIPTITMRQKRLVGPLWIYLLMMVVNLLLRFAWSLTLLPVRETSEFSIVNSILRNIAPLVAMAEIIRRMLWSIFRIEYEQLTQLSKISLDFTTISSKENNFEMHHKELEADFGNISSPNRDDLNTSVEVSLNNTYNAMPIGMTPSLPVEKNPARKQQYSVVDGRYDSTLLQFIEYDWVTYILLIIPFGDNIVKWIEISHFTKCTLSYRSKILFFEAIFFAVWVLYVILITATFKNNLH